MLSGFLASVRSDPAHSALEVNGVAVTYGDLWEYASRIASLLDQSIPLSEQFVAFLAGRRVSSYATLLGILRTGRCYVPLNAELSARPDSANVLSFGCEDHYP